MRPVLFRSAFALTVLVMCARHAAADDPLGLYAGVEVGQSRVAATGQVIDTPAVLYYQQGSFDENHSAFQVMAGIRPIPVLGAELDYLNLGRPSGGFNAYSAEVSMKGVRHSAFFTCRSPRRHIPEGRPCAYSERPEWHRHIGPALCFLKHCGVPSVSRHRTFRLRAHQHGRCRRLGAQYKFGPVAVRAE